MRRPVTYEADALRELREAVDRYEAQTPGLGLDLWESVLDAIREGVPLPISYRRTLGRDRTLKRMLVARYHYTVVAVLGPGAAVHVIAVAHQHRKPGYWRRRLARLPRT